MSIIYQDCQLATKSDTTVQIQKVISRNDDIIQRAGDYCVAIQRLVFPMGSVHMWQPELLLGQVQNPPITTKYRCRLSFGATDGPITYMSLIRSNFTDSVPPVPLTAQPTNDYSVVTSQATVINMLNNWFKQAFLGLEGAIGGMFPGLVTQPQAPYFTWNPATSLITLNGFPSAVYDVTNPSQTSIVIWIGAEFRSFLDGFNYTIYNSSPSATAKDIQLIMSQSAESFLDELSTAAPNTWVGPPGAITNLAAPRNATTALLQCSQDYPAPWAFDCALSSVQIVSSLPTVLEFSDPPTAQLGQIINASQPILMDFVPDLSSSLGNNSSPILYTSQTTIPGARYVELQGTAPIRSFSIAAQWVDSYGVVRPLYTSSACQSASIKLVFIKKSILFH